MTGKNFRLTGALLAIAGLLTGFVWLILRSNDGGIDAIVVLPSIVALGLIVMLVRNNRRLKVDLDERLRAVERLREAEQRNRAAFQHTGDLLFIADCTDSGDGVIESVNGEMEKLLGRPIDELRGESVVDVIGGEPGRLAQSNLVKCVGSGRRVRFDAVMSERAFDFVLMPLRNAEGRVTRVLGSARDFTERNRMEEALRQTQKLEAIGQLTGGVAHDFNNLLQVILGNLELLLPKLGDEALVRRAQNAILAAERGQGITRHLLAFARQQPLAARTLAMPRVFTTLAPMLRSSLGDRVEFEIDVAPDVWRVHVDPGQLDGALLNLVVNARDAMPGGGRLRIEVGNVRVDPDFGPHGDLQAGEYVSIRVVDSGGGIPPEILANAFQPFFTTKPVGRGTGLGLSMVYGFARQSGGAAEIDSVVGRGTTVTMLLPRAESDEADDDPREAEALGGAEAILVVEDDAAVRETVVEMLRSLGYAVTDVPSATEALAMLEAGRAVDLLLTDVVMPGGITGVDLARRAEAMRPRLRILLASGYADDRISGAPLVGEKWPLLEKPYRRADLARRIRALLDAGVPAPVRGDAVVLVVEDDALVRMVAVDALTEAGLRPFEAATGAEALAAAARDDIAVAIVDLGLPDMTGHELMAELRVRRPTLPLIVVSGSSALPSDLAGGMITTLAKPYAAAALVRAVRTALGCG